MWARSLAARLGTTSSSHLGKHKMANKDKDRIVALQRQIRVARAALLRVQHYARDSAAIAGAALDEMNEIEWNSKPTPMLAQHEADRR